MKFLRRSGLPSELSFARILERAAVLIWYSDFQSEQLRRATKGKIVKYLLAFLLIRPYRYEECDSRFFLVHSRQT